MFSVRWLVTTVLLLLLTGCVVGPKYKRPPVTVPDTYRGLSPDAGPQAAASLGDEKWWTVFQDPQLQVLIRVCFRHKLCWASHGPISSRP
jgi:outer membrane protein, multidrug efflux system